MLITKKKNGGGPRDGRARLPRAEETGGLAAAAALKPQIHGSFSDIGEGEVDRALFRRREAVLIFAAADSDASDAALSRRVGPELKGPMRGEVKHTEKVENIDKTCGKGPWESGEVGTRF